MILSDLKLFHLHKNGQTRFDSNTANNNTSIGSNITNVDDLFFDSKKSVEKIFPPKAYSLPVPIKKKARLQTRSLSLPRKKNSSIKNRKIKNNNFFNSTQ
jgi:hypothetical protein